jgi:hypothetical protein
MHRVIARIVMHLITSVVFFSFLIISTTIFYGTVDSLANADRKATV